MTARRRVRAAVRDALAELPGPVCEAPPLVGCSGGADSTALVLAVREVVEGPVHAAVVDHGLQDGSAERSAELAVRLRAAGIEAAVHPVQVTGPGGTEAAARRARRAALLAARPHPSSAVLLGHTLDDQAETVLLGLGRGSGARSLAGMRAWSAPWLRPLLGLRRADTADACAEAGVPVWADPHNTDPRFTRARVRHEVLPLLEEVLGGGVTEALARTADQLRDDDTALDEQAARLREAAGEPGCAVPGTDRDDDAVGNVPVPRDSGDSDPGAGVPQRLPEPARDASAGTAAPALDATVLATAPAAVRRRVLREWLAAHGVRALTDAQLRAADDLVGRWRGQGGPTLGGGLELTRTRGRLVLRRRRWGRDRA
ncbi:tRNA(Ile)-lysidine synthetase [Pseudonocardia sp. Ae168_Ps1]|uniref:tRNA lysidine(34) synthetase TilS n=1 Tax=unclassified Pseudonocardia TaxID=2619320 RepID=UPI00094B07F3|nr:MULTISPECIES: tRNA lysidine(34) synthetase TilS [unclassified Pseudonocardia]OLL74719.1 tRNA(Ile)-lysidine synthetase [Pseudonocardia sp. Ae150A_Ps1]OLL80701.1 tRNA(Ile)-lysidine synthetase [Pseudonocardia sp. Ae168_Ps1]OLL85172.1 tRNA(Ile)-lysidine synthetase [Pseudonocardia sp. Ae263_Ps1]OLL94803.1 tRNA(Ile)-lysidine synthetase [Pseudonocardia sp. Ae356_Ps1]